MTSDIAAFYKILKDDTNQKILAIINENDRLSYADLMEKTEIYSEALFNCHLKVLSDLLRKNEEDQYVLTEMGQLALKMLKESPEQIKKFERKKMKYVGVYIGLCDVSICIVAIVCYFQGYIDDFRLLRRIVILASLSIILYVGYYIVNFAGTSESIKKKRNIVGNFGSVVLGGSIGGLVAMIGLIIATLISVSRGGPNFWHVTDSYGAFNDIYFGSSFVIGGIVGHYIYKKFIKTRL